MGKRSGSKRARRHRKMQSHKIPPKKDRSKDARPKQDPAFEATCDALSSHFAEYAASDVAIALSVSDLWLPNRSSQVKHALAAAVFVAMPEEMFTEATRIESYDRFKLFIEKAYDLLPDFASLEDFVPEADWGEIKYLLGDSTFNIFYGGAVERISDFIAAFELVHAGNLQPNVDMQCALSVQDYVIRHVEPQIAGSAERVDSGHIEIPSEDFWIACRDAILSLSQREHLSDLSAGLIVKLGEQARPGNSSVFGDSVITGSAVTAFLVEISGRRFPLAIRNAAAVTLEHWAKEGKTASHDALANFVERRFRRVLKGPFSIVTRQRREAEVFSAAIYGGEKVYLILIQDKNNLAQLQEVEKSVQRATRAGTWALQVEGEKGALQLGRTEGASPAYEDVVVVAVLSDVSTEPSFLNMPKTNIRLLPLPDFVSIFDAVGSTNELDRYWAFLEAESAVLMPMSGLTDRFAAFREAHALLADGAIVPTMIALDPHWGADWRYRELSKYWASAPASFPRRLKSEWTVSVESGGLKLSSAKRIPALSWVPLVGGCTCHFMVVVDEEKLHVDDARVLALLANCLADAVNERSAQLVGLSAFERKQIVTVCRPRLDALLSIPESDTASGSVFSGWRIIQGDNPEELELEVEVNLQRVQKSISGVKDAAFEVDVTIEWLEGIGAALELPVADSALQALRSTSSRRPRFLMQRMVRTVDVPDHADPMLPDLEHFKIARRDLAVAFKDSGARPGKYELNEAKPLIDQARDNYRASLHDIIARFDRAGLVRYCVEQIDQLIANFDRKEGRIQMSLGHDVAYDRAESLAKAYEQFTKESRNYRYLLEACLSMPVSGLESVSQRAIPDLLAHVDWLLVLSNASDVLHNGIDVAGLELDSSFVPHVYYSEIHDKEMEFASEAADFRLGTGLTIEDQVRSVQPGAPEWSRLSDAFRRDAGVGLEKFLAALSILFRWPSANGESSLSFSYSANESEVREVLVRSVEGLSQDEANSAIALVTLQPKGIRRLIGKTVDEIDVPLWEHNKRGDRYVLKPLIRDEANLLWGAASVERSARLWQQSLTQGYMPADFDWPNVRRVTEEIKASLDVQLEVAAAAVLERSTPYVAQGVDFARRFPAERFDDVGDFDGLAYWPNLNQWVVVECKYNQPAFCLKDARRLRERIFGRPGRDKAQFDKIERRSAFLRANVDRLRGLLGWPDAPAGVRYEVKEVYVSRHIYWWMRNSPYEVAVDFVRVDALENWLHREGLTESKV